MQLNSKNERNAIVLEGTALSMQCSTSCKVQDVQKFTFS